MTVDRFTYTHSITSIKAEKKHIFKRCSTKWFSVDHLRLSMNSISQRSKFTEVLLFRYLFFHIPSKKLKFARGFVLSKCHVRIQTLLCVQMDESISTGISFTFCTTLCVVRCQSKNAAFKKHSLSFTGDMRHNHKAARKQQNNLPIQSKSIIIGHSRCYGCRNR